MVNPIDIMNDGANFIRREMGMNVIPADTRNKRPIVEWKRFEIGDVTEELHQQWTNRNMFDKGIAMFCDLVRPNKRKKGIYLNCIDLDNEPAIREFCTIKGLERTLEELAERGIDSLNILKNPAILKKIPFTKTRSTSSGLNPDTNLIYRLQIGGAFKNQRRSLSNNDD